MGACGPATEMRCLAGGGGASGTGCIGRPEALVWGVGQEAEVFWEGPYPLREQPHKATLTTDR